MASRSVIITAGGIGKRMDSDLPKQFLLLGTKPILMHTIELFYRFDENIEILLTLPADWRGYWETLVEKHYFRVPHLVISGGEERFDSIKNALKRVTGEVVAVHDGVRPFTSQAVIKSCFQELEKYEVVVPAIPIKESIRQVTNDKNFSVKRDEFRLIQTPQCFRSQVLKTLYEQPYNTSFTDDASLAEKMNIPVHLLPGNEENIKITTRLDMLIAETLIAKNK
ncbi:MAG: 2-C-methyl-D-erythritol 4-phosphate cytidylyltransferase [Crocinitomicaceae bacterium]